VQINRADNAQARANYQQSIDIEASSVVYAMLGFAHLIDLLYGWSDSQMESFGGTPQSRSTRLSIFIILIGDRPFEMGLEENGDDIGTLKATPILLMVGYQSLPKNQTGFAFHATIGGGMASSDFEKGDVVKDLENTSGGNIDISSDSAFMFELGAGMDYFFTKNIALTLDGRFFKWKY